MAVFCFFVLSIKQIITIHELIPKLTSQLYNSMVSDSPFSYLLLFMWLPSFHFILLEMAACVSSGYCARALDILKATLVWYFYCYFKQFLPWILSF